MRSTYRVLAILIAVVVVLQAASIAFAWFDVLSAVDDGKAFSDIEDRNAGHNMHSIGAILIAVLGLLLLIVSFFAKIPDGVKWAGIVFGVVVLQWVLAIVAFGVPAIGFLHGINALVLAGVAGRASRQASVTDAPASAPTAA